MKGKKTMQMVLVAMLIIAMPIVSAFDGKVAEANDIKVKDVNAMTEDVMAKIPETYKETEANIVPVRSRYLLWTRDGKHIMWGTYGNGFFVGADNLGKKAWGIYGKKVFAGFYDGEFFWGKYSRGRWKAHGLFDLNTAQGRYVLFPTLVAEVTEAVPK